MNILGIQNADGTLVPLLEAKPGDSRITELSLVSQNQRKAQIRIYALPEGIGFETLPKKSHLARSLCGILEVKNLPENPFGELRIKVQLQVEDNKKVKISTWINDEARESKTFKIVSPRKIGEIHKEKKASLNKNRQKNHSGFFFAALGISIFSCFELILAVLILLQKLSIIV